MGKYKKGSQLTWFDAASCIANGVPIYHRDKVQTAGWTQNWSIRYIIQQANRGALYACWRKRDNTTGAK